MLHEPCAFAVLQVIRVGYKLLTDKPSCSLSSIINKFDGIFNARADSPAFSQVIIHHPFPYVCCCCFVVAHACVLHCCCSCVTDVHMD